MTDQNQVTDPQTQGTQQDDKNNQDSDVFGGSGDIFENNDILEPIKDVNKDDNLDKDTTAPEIVETMPDKEIEETIEVKKDDFFDPFNDDEAETEIEEESIEKIAEDVVEEKPEIVENNDVPDFENSPEIDALDDLDNLDSLDEIKVEEENIEKIVEDVVEEKPEIIEKIKDDAIEETEKVIEKEKVNIGSTIERIEKRAKEAKLAAEKAEQAAQKEVVKEKEIDDTKEEIEEVVENIVEDTMVEDIKEDKVETVEEVEIPVITEEENIEIKKDDPLKTDLQNKFGELMDGTRGIYTLLTQDTSEWFDIVWWNDDRIKTTYNIIMWEDNIEINKIELNKADDTVQEYKLEFVVDKASLNVKVDDELLYDEVTDLQENVNKKMQVMEKLNKFIFLVTEEFKKLEMEKWKKQKRNIMKWIFRNFMF